MKYIFSLFWLLIIIVGITFASLNSQMVAINYYTAESHLHLPILLLITLVIGALLGIIAMVPWLLKIKHSNRKLRHRIKQIEQEVNNLRAIPIKETH